MSLNCTEPDFSVSAGYRMLSDRQLEEIHQASLEILERTGVRVFDSRARDLLVSAGCRVSDENRVHIPAEVIDSALATAPSEVVLFSRTGEPALFLEGHRSYFGTGSDLPYTLDLESGERRLSRLSDVEQTARLADALPNLDFVMSMALPSDIPSATSDLRSFLAMSTNTSKPLVFTAWDETNLADILSMAEIIAGGADRLRQKPFLICYLEPNSPLQHSQVVLRKMALMAERHLPIVYAPGPIDGATAPVTPAGSLAMANAESLSGLAIAQLYCPGTPVILGSGSGPLDMRTAVGTYASPEFILHCMGMAELAHHLYHIPVWGFSGCSDSKIPDMQAGIESTLWVLWTALSGANLVHDIGYLESGLTCSYEMIVVNDEIIAFVRRLLQGFTINPETLAVEAINAVGPGGDFLTSTHTHAHFREIWYPGLFDRRNQAKWAAAGSSTLLERARVKVRRLLESHVPNPLPGENMEQLDSIIRLADERAGLGNIFS